MGRPRVRESLAEKLQEILWGWSIEKREEPVPYAKGSHRGFKQGCGTVRVLFWRVSPATV